MGDDDRRITIQDILQWSSISNLCFDEHHEDGSLFFTVSSHSLATNTSVSEIHQFRFHDRHVRKITYHHQDSSLQVLPPISGLRHCLYFLRDGNIHGLPLDGGEVFRVSSSPVPIESYKLGYLFDQIYWVIVQNVPPKDHSLDIHPDRKLSSSGVVFDSLMVRHWNQWNPYAKRNHIFYYTGEISNEELLVQSNENGQDLMFELECDCPLKGSRFQHHEYSLSPDGSKIIICTRPTLNKQQLHDFAWTTHLCIYLGDLNNLKQFSWDLISGDDSQVFHSHPIFAPDNQTIAFLRMSRQGFEQDRYSIYVYDVSSKSRHCITDSIDVSFRTIQFGQTSSELFATGVYHGTMRVFRINWGKTIDGVMLKGILVLDGDAARSEICFCRSQNSLAYTESSIISTPELYSIDLFTSEDFKDFSFMNLEEGVFPYPTSVELSLSKHVILCPNPAMSNGDKLVPSLYQLHFKGAMNDVVHAWYLAPTDIDSNCLDKSIPMVVILHGGPQGSVFNAWVVRWNLAWYASQGYATLAINFHGSSGFGQNFMDSIHHDWGGKPLEDIHRGIDFALQNFSYLNPKSMAALGSSYGGYLVNWINGHTDRFRCLVSHDGIFTLGNLYYQTEELWFPEWEFGKIGDCDEELRKWSPDVHLKMWRTPTLVIHGGRDHRVPETEGIATFSTLQRLGIPSKFLYFSDEGHFISKPQNNLLWHDTVHHWLQQFL